MPYAILFFDAEGSEEARNRLRDAHISYMDKNRQRVLASGGLLSDDGTIAHGGLIVIDTESRFEAEKFVADDPFKIGGVYGSCTISRWRKAFFNRERLI